MKIKIKTIFLKSIIFFLPITVVFANNKIDYKDKFYFGFESFFKFAPFMWIYTTIQLWYKNNEVFSTSLGLVLLVNMFVGMALHMKLGTFSWKELLLKTVKTLSVIFVVYVSLKALNNVLTDSYFGGLFKSTIEFITILYPASKVLENTFILTDGKHPPEFIIKALYNYKKDGKLKDFFETLNVKREMERQTNNHNNKEEDENTGN